MRLRLPRWIASIALNSGSLIATTAVTSAFGVVYWWVAAHEYPAAAVGQAGALISAMTLLGVVATIGLSTALIPSLAEGRPERGRLVATALTAVGVAGLLLGALWQAAAGRFAPELSVGGSGPWPLLLFAAGVSLTTVTLVLDQALVGLLRGDLQLVRNTVFAVVKLLALAAAGASAVAGRDAGTIFASWAAGNAASLLVLGVVGARSLALPRLRLLRGLRGTALLHHAFNLALTAPGWILPLEVTVLLSTAANAYFYTAWTIAGFVFVGPIALTTVLYAVGVQDRGLGRPLRLTLSLSLLWAAGAAVGTFLLGGWALGLFGRAYAAGGTAALLALSLAVFPQVAKLHAVALARLRGRLAPGVALLVAGGVLELGLVALGALRGGVTGAAAGWTAAIAVEGAAMVPVIRRALRRAPVPRVGGPVRRVLMVTPRYHPFTGGIETHVHELAARLVARGIEVCVLTTDPTGRLPGRELADGIEIRRCPAWGWLGDLALAPSLPGALAAEECDVVHLQGVHTLVAPLALLALSARRVPLVVTFHSGGHTSRLRTALRPLQWRALRPGLAAAEGLVAVSEFEAALFARALGVSRARIAVIPNGFELPPAAEPADPDPDASPLLLSIGRLERYKGHHRVIRALGTVLRAHPRAQLQVVGTGPYEGPLRRLAAELAMADRVRFASFAPGERAGLRRLLERADLVALLSEYEAHPVAAAEAAGLGRRVLVADNSGLRELADRGLATAVSLRRSDQELGQAMVELLDRPAPRRPEALAGWDACADRHVELYRCVSSC